MQSTQLSRSNRNGLVVGFARGTTAPGGLTRPEVTEIDPAAAEAKEAALKELAEAKELAELEAAELAELEEVKAKLAANSEAELIKKANELEAAAELEVKNSEIT